MTALVLALVMVACDEATLPSEGLTYALTTAAVTLDVGETLQLPSPSPKGQDASWRSSDPGVATVTQTGLVQAVAEGTASIDAKAGPYRSSTQVTVRAVQPVTGSGLLEVTPSSATVVEGGTVQLTGAVKDSGGNVVPNVTFTWSSSNPAVATVSGAGLVSGVSEGSAVVIVSGGGYADTAAVSVTAASVPAGFFVAPNGSASGDGSLARPWDLATALNQPPAVQPGAVIWLRGGTYHGTFTSNLNGTAAAPIVVRQYAGERATIDAGALSETAGALTVRGEWTQFRDLELMSSALHRTSSRPHGLLVYASNTRFINLVIHDVGVAIYTADDRTNVEIYGCIIYNNGWETTRGNGHAVYIKNSTGSKVVRDNIAFNQFGYGLHGYTNLGSGGLYGLTFDGNVSFNNGSLSANPSANTANLLLGGQEPVERGLVTNNLTYFSPGVQAYNVVLGWSSASSRDVTATGNYIVGGDNSLQVWAFEQANISGNLLYTPYRAVQLADGTLAGHVWSSNSYHRDPLAQAWRHESSYYSFPNWQSQVKLDATSQAIGGAPAATRVFVRPNAYEPGRATIVVYNWGKQGLVTADLAGVLNAGDRYEVRNVQDFFGAPVASGTFGGGTIGLPMTGVTAAQPIGGSPSPAPRTGPDFDVFVVRRTGG
jgi:hypothetical protein